MTMSSKVMRFAAALISLVSLLALSSCQKQPVDRNDGSDSTPIASSVSDPDAQASIELPSVVGENPESSNGVDSTQTSSQPSEMSSTQSSGSLVSISANDSQSESSMVPFTLGKYLQIPAGGTYTEADSYARLINSMNELDDAIDGKWSGAHEQYNDAFFEDHAIVFMVTYHKSNSYQNRVDAITRSGRQLMVEYTTLHPMICEDVSGCFWTLLEIDKSDAAGITETVLKPHIIEQKVGDSYNEGDYYVPEYEYQMISEVPY